MIATGKYTEQVNERIKVIKKEMENTDSEFDREKCQERIAKLGGAIGRIKVGAATETELKDKKLRYEDALNSVKAAMDEGIVPGGGSTLVYLLRTKDKVMPDANLNSECPRNALQWTSDGSTIAPLISNPLAAPADSRRHEWRGGEARRRSALPRHTGAHLPDCGECGRGRRGGPRACQGAGVRIRLERGDRQVRRPAEEWRDRPGVGDTAVHPQLLFHRRRGHYYGCAHHGGEGEASSGSRRVS